MVKADKTKNGSFFGNLFGSKEQRMDDAKDLYGNRDPVHAATGLQAAKKARAHLSKLPAHYSRFYANRMARAVGPDE